MKRQRRLYILMCLTLVVIIAFQVYWLRDNYGREKRTLQLKTAAVFQETLQQLQATKLKLPGDMAFFSGRREEQRFLLDENSADLYAPMKQQRQMITMVNTLSSKLRDSLKKDTSLKTTIVVSLDKGPHINFKDSSRVNFKSTDSNKQVFNILSKVDSIQNTLDIAELNRAFAENLKKQNLDIAFTAFKKAGNTADEKDLAQITIGFAHPFTYSFLLNNTGFYIIKRLTLPILFSLFLLGITVFSFVLLYRNLIRQQKLAEAKNEFISNITHELKTPIATVGVAIEALKNFRALDDPQKTAEYLDISSNELQRLELLVEKVLRLSMFEKKEMQVSKERFDLQELTTEILNTMKLQFEKNNAVVHFQTSGNDFTVYADKLHMSSVVYNLLDNALKYSKEAPVINVALSAEKDEIKLSVSDNGIGIAAEYQGKIFDKFFRVPTSNRHAVKGYGLGLSYVSHIITQHHGTIQVQSEINKGSTFSVKLPTGNAES